MYLYAWQVTGRPSYRQVVEQTLDYVLREMTDAAGGFTSAQDADSEGKEGEYYLWRQTDLRRLLGDETAAVFSQFYDVTHAGNFEGKNILHVIEDVPTLARRLDIPEAELQRQLSVGREALLQARGGRVKPGLDDKVLAGWNGKMLAAFADAGRVLQRPEYVAAAEANAAFLLREMSKDGRLRRAWKGGRVGRQGAFLEDYACVIDGLLALYQATADPTWYRQSLDLSKVVWAHFRDAGGGFFDTADDHEALIVRPKQMQDNVLPAGNSQMAEVLLRLAAYGGDPQDAALAESYRRYAEDMLSATAETAGRFPRGFGYWLCVLTLQLSEPIEVAVVGAEDDIVRRQMLDVLANTYRPFLVLAVGSGDQAQEAVPLLKGRGLPAAGAVAYVCRRFVCAAPMTDAAALALQLDGPPAAAQGETRDEA